MLYELEISTYQIRRCEFDDNDLIEEGISQRLKTKLQIDVHLEASQLPLWMDKGQKKRGNHSSEVSKSKTVFLSVKKREVQTL